MTLVDFFIVGINIQNKQCFITLLEIIEPEKLKGIRAKIKSSFPPQMLQMMASGHGGDPAITGLQYNINTTTQEYKEKKLEIGQTVKLDVPQKLSDIVINNEL